MILNLGVAYAHYVTALFSFVPNAATSLDALPAMTVAQFDQLHTEVAGARMTDRTHYRATQTVASLLRGGERLYWS